MTIAAVEICGRYRDAGAAFLCEVAEEEEEMASASPHLTSRVESTGPFIGTTGIVDEELTTEGDPERVQQGYLPGGDAHLDHQGNDEHFHVEEASPWGDDDEGTGTRDSRGRNLPFGVTVVRTSSPNLLSTSSSLERSFSTYCVLCQF